MLGQDQRGRIVAALWRDAESVHGFLHGPTGHIRRIRGVRLVLVGPERGRCRNGVHLHRRVEDRAAVTATGRMTAVNPVVLPMAPDEADTVV